MNLDENEICEMRFAGKTLRLHQIISNVNYEIY